MEIYMNMLLIDTCELGAANCRNRHFNRAKYARVKPFKTFMKGWGLRLEEDVSAGQFLLEYLGEVINNQMCRERIECEHERVENLRRVLHGNTNNGNGKGKGKGSQSKVKTKSSNTNKGKPSTKARKRKANDSDDDNDAHNDDDESDTIDNIRRNGRQSKKGGSVVYAPRRGAAKLGPKKVKGHRDAQYYFLTIIDDVVLHLCYYAHRYYYYVVILTPPHLIFNG
jgi:hypothetical protein